MAITQRIAARHEALTLRLEALAHKVEALAARRPQLAVDPTTRALAEDLLFACRPFFRTGGALPPAAPDVAGLAVQLAEARARLEAFELRHTRWHPGRRCVVWQTGEAEEPPVQRLHPQPLPASGDEKESREQRRIRQALQRRISELYQDGYDDALAGRPPRR